MTDPTAPLFAAVDTSTLAGNVTTLTVALLALPIIFLAAKYIRKTMSRG